MMPNTITITPVSVRRFRVEDLARIRPQAAQETEYLYYCSDDTAHALITSGPAWTAWRGNRPLGCAGFMPSLAGTAQVWTIIDVRTHGTEFLTVHKLVARKLQEFSHTWQRFEMFVTADYLNGHRWAELLGFTLDGWYQRAHPEATYAIFAKTGAT